MTMTAVKESPILLRDELVRATLADIKNQTRRPITNKKALALLEQGFSPEYVARRDTGLCRYGYAGDRLWIKEAWSADMHVPGTGDLWYHETPKSFRTWRGATYLFYRADGSIVHGGRHDEVAPPNWMNVPWRERISDWKPKREEMQDFRWQSSRFMPRWASRILLEITELRVQRVQDISEDDARAEGIDGCPVTSWAPWVVEGECRTGFADLWDRINGPRGYRWNTNPWVWALTFRRLT